MEALKETVQLGNIFLSFKLRKQNITINITLLTPFKLSRKMALNAWFCAYEGKEMRILFSQKQLSLVPTNYGYLDPNSENKGWFILEDP